MYCRGIKLETVRAAMLLETNATLGAKPSQHSMLNSLDDADAELGSAWPSEDDGTYPSGYEEASAGSDDSFWGSVHGKGANTSDPASEDTVLSLVGRAPCGAPMDPSYCSFRPSRKLSQKYNAMFMELAHPVMGVTKNGGTFAVFGAEATPPGNCDTGPDSFKPSVPQNLIVKTAVGGESGERKLTNFRTLADGSASRIKLLDLEPGRHLIMYEVWKSKEYDSTVVMVVDDDGDTLEGPWTPSLPNKILAHSDELLLIDGKVVIYDGGSGELYRYVLEVAGEGRNLPPAPAPTPWPTPAPPPTSFQLQKEKGSDQCIQGSNYRVLQDVGGGCTQFEYTAGGTLKGGGGCIDWYASQGWFNIWSCHGRNNQVFQYDAREGSFMSPASEQNGEARLYIVGFAPPTKSPTPAPAPSPDDSKKGKTKKKKKDKKKKKNKGDRKKKKKKKDRKNSKKKRD
jgi:hypothetical protein